MDQVLVYLVVVWFGVGGFFSFPGAVGWLREWILIAEASLSAVVTSLRWLWEFIIRWDRCWPFLLNGLGCGYVVVGILGWGVVWVVTVHTYYQGP